MSAGSYVWGEGSAQGGFAMVLVAHARGFMTWDLCPAAFAQEAFAPVAYIKGL